MRLPVGQEWSRRRAQPSVADGAACRTGTMVEAVRRSRVDSTGRRGPENEPRPATCRGCSATGSGRCAASPLQLCGRRSAAPPNISGKPPPCSHRRGEPAQNLYQAGFDAAWELDLFGGQRRNVESANANMQASTEGISDAQVTIAAEVALNYVQLRGYQQQIVVAQKNLKSSRIRPGSHARKRMQGLNATLDIANADANVATTEAQIPVFETEARQSIYALSVLLARPPADLLEQLTPTGNIPGVPAAGSSRFALRPAAPPSRHSPGRSANARRHRADRGRNRGPVSPSFR